MASTASEELRIQYQGHGATASDIWGMTQANFLVHFPGAASKEVAVMVNDAAAGFLAARYAQENTLDFRQSLARVVGRLWIEGYHRQFGHAGSVLTISRATFDEQPGLLAAVDGAVGR
ncbi:MAG: hypothetical protein ACR2HN_00620 [Tepidiformaceae bacterium]